MNIGLLTWISICTVATAIGCYEARKNLIPDWTTTPAKFERFELGSRDRRVYPIYHYTYYAEGRLYSGRDGSLMRTTYANPSEAKSEAYTYFPIDRLVVSYDRNNPEISDLNPFSRGTAWSFVYLPPLIMIAGIRMHYLGTKIKIGR